MKKIDSLLESKAKNDKAIVEIADSLRETLRKLDDAVGRRQQREDGKQKNQLPSFTTVLLLLIGVVIGYCLNFSIPVTQDKPSIVIPAEETLEEFVAREAERLLSAIEIAKLITVTETILQQDFSRPSAIVEEFVFQRRIAGINSPAFNVFSDKWAAKVEETADGRPQTAAEGVETMRSIYKSLMRGLQRCQEPEENLLPSAICGLPSSPPDSLLLTPPQQRQRLFRTITTP